MDEEEVLRAPPAPEGRGHRPPALGDLRHPGPGLHEQPGGGALPGRPPVRGRGHRGRAPGREPQLPAHPRVQPLVHAGRRARLAGWGSRTRWSAWPRRPRAESMRLLPTLKLYKINVQLDMTGTQATDAKEDAPRPPPVRGDGVLPTESDKAMIAILQRDLPVESRPFDTWAAEAGIATPTICWPPPRSSSSAATCAASPRCSTTARPGSAPTAWPCGRCPRRSWRSWARAWPPSRPSRTATSGRPTPTGPTASSPWSTQRSREACEEAIAAIAEETGITDPDRRAVLYSTFEFKKIRLMYFTPDYREWEDLALAGAPLPRWGELSTTTTRSAELFDRARRVLVGGVNSPVRAMRSIGRDPLFIARAEGPHVWDADGNRYVDYLSSWGPAILGHAPAAVLSAAPGRPAAGHVLRRAHRARGALRRGRGRRRCRRSSSCA